MDRETSGDRTMPDTDDRTPDEAETDVEGHNFEFYRQEARQRAAEAEAQAKAAARAREARHNRSERNRHS